MSSEERVVDRRESESSLDREERSKRSPSVEEEEELDEFGRVKRRRDKFKSERAHENDEDRSDNEHKSRYRRHRRRSSSTSRSPSRRSYRRRYSESDSDDERRRHQSTSRHRSSSRHRQHHTYRDHRHHYYRNGANMYSEAAQYIDTEFYPTKIYIGDLENVTESQVESIFSRFGVLEGVRLVEGKDYGFVTYERKEDALAAIQSMHGALLGSRHIKVNRAKIPERNKIGFGNVPWQDEDGLMAKEASSEYNNNRKSYADIDDSSSHSYSVDPSIARRVLTSYDDL